MVLIAPGKSGRAASTIIACLACLAGTICVSAADQPQWGERYTRNMVSRETGLPDSFDPETGRNVVWTQKLGTNAYATPIISNGRIYVGTNNEGPYEPRYEEDAAVLYCLSEADGSLLWRLSVPKLTGNRSYQDWPNIGFVSPVTVEGDFVYLVNNRNQVMCLDVYGLSNGNQGPFKDEGSHMSPHPDSLLQVENDDADILWIYDIEAELNVQSHDEAFCSILIHGPNLYVCTSSGVDAKHGYVVAPEAPSLIVLDKASGRLVAHDVEPIGPNIVHSTWSSPALLQEKNSETIVFGAGNGVCYGFEPVPFERDLDAPARALKKLWEFDCDPTAPKENIHQYRGNRRMSASNIYGMPVVYQNRVYITYGGDFWHGKNMAWVKCFEPKGSGDITGKAELWSYPLEEHCMGTPAVYQDLVFIGDTGGFIHCIDALTGEPQWKHDTKGVIWGSVLVADNKVYVVNRRGKAFVFSASREKTLIS
ncbi:MAG: PQQ-binding-like beta-propeller repeat protein, partial [Verrucomicrobiae bacterium]|nr:PQQ-binding-like beta-propeller repeat protein [Verrucomicrobiae bacterium]